MCRQRLFVTVNIIRAQPTIIAAPDLSTNTQQHRRKLLI